MPFGSASFLYSPLSLDIHFLSFPVDLRSTRLAVHLSPEKESNSVLALPCRDIHPPNTGLKDIGQCKKKGGKKRRFFSYSLERKMGEKRAGLKT